VAGIPKIVLSPFQTKKSEDVHHVDPSYMAHAGLKFSWEWPWSAGVADSS